MSPLACIMLSVVTGRGDVMMRVLCAVLLGLVVVCFAGGIALSADPAGADSVSSSGVVYGYGVKLTPPYEFTKSEDGKTLYLNGLIYAGPGDEETPEVTVTEDVRAEHELSMRAYEESKKGATYDERLARLAATYTSSPLVESVRKHGEGLYVRWASNPGDEYVITLQREEERPDFNRDAFWQKQISRFWRIIDSGGMVVFGEKYHIFCPDSSVPKTLDQIARVRRGVSREDLDTRDTPLIDHNFLEDLYREGESAERE
jgi:hypothetical protein